jgi:RNA polymerase sigma factor (sigma-70 family)
MSGISVHDIEAYRPWIRWLARHSRSYDEDDLLQDVRLKLLKIATKCQSRDHLSHSKMMRIIKTCAISRWRRERRHSFTVPLDDRIASEVSTKRYKSRQATTLDLSDLTATLFPDEWQLLQGRWIRNFSFADLARELGISEAAARKRAWRLRRRLCDQVCLHRARRRAVRAASVAMKHIV